MNTLETMIAAATAHRACCGTEHDAPNGKLHGYCVVCGVEWPCETARAFIFTSQPPYPYLAVCQDLAQILQAPLPSDGGPGDLGDLVEAIRNRMARLEDRAACLQATLDENRQLKDQLIEAQDLQHAAQDAAGKAQTEVEQAQENHREVLGRLFKAEAERDEFRAGLHSAFEEAAKKFQILHAILGSSAGEELGRRAERVMKALDDARHEAGKAKAEAAKARSEERELCIQAAWKWAKEGPVSLLNQEGLRAAVAKEEDDDACPF